MTPVLIDSNVLIDIFTKSPEWGLWSRDQLTWLAGMTKLYINPVVYSEISIGFNRIEELDSLLKTMPLALSEIPKEALFLAGKVFLSYRKGGGSRTSALPDFYIGAHAAVRGWRIITRDKGRIAYYFPSLQIISPDSPAF